MRHFLVRRWWPVAEENPIASFDTSPNAKIQEVMVTAHEVMIPEGEGAPLAFIILVVRDGQLMPLVSRIFKEYEDVEEVVEVVVKGN